MSRTLNLAAQILGKMFFERNQPNPKLIQSSEVFFIERITDYMLLTLNGKHFNLCYNNKF